VRHAAPVSRWTAPLAAALLAGGWLVGGAAAGAVGAPPDTGALLGLGLGLLVSAAVLRRPARGGGALFAVLAAVAGLLWAAVGYLLLIELSTLLRGAETEHSPLLVVALLALPTAAATTAAVRVRPTRRPRRPA
jgi:hypothetical protein